MPRSIILIALTMTSSAQLGFGQCYTAPQQAPCPIPDGSCSKLVPLVQPTGNGYSYYWNIESCCGYKVNVVIRYQNECQIAELRSPDVQARLLAEARVSDVLVVGCDGYLRQLPHGASAVPPISLTPVEDRKLFVPSPAANPAGERR
jgi:hypothetical protein